MSGRRHRSPRRGLARALLALSLLLGRARDARAGDDHDDDLAAARVAFSEASAFAERQQWSAACERYERSLKLHHAALTLYSLGVAQREAGRLVAARASFQWFLGEPPTPATQPYQQPARSAVAELRARIGSLTLVLVPGPVEGATVTVDAAPFANESPTQAQPIDPGTHRIVVRAPGRAQASGPVTVAEGGTATLTLTLARLEPGSAADRQSRAFASGETPASWPRALPVALLGVGGAALLGGLALGVSGVVEAQNAPSAQGPPADRARAMGIAGDALIGAGIATAAAGLILLLIQKNHPTLAGAPPWNNATSPGPWLRF